jgi:hypothetical protein
MAVKVAAGDETTRARRAGKGNELSLAGAAGSCNSVMVIKARAEAEAASLPVERPRAVLQP